MGHSLHNLEPFKYYYRWVTYATQDGKPETSKLLKYINNGWIPVEKNGQYIINSLAPIIFLEKISLVSVRKIDKFKKYIFNNAKKWYTYYIVPDIINLPR